MLKNLDKKVKEIIKGVLTEYAPIVVNESNSKVNHPTWTSEVIASSGTEVTEDTLKVYYDSEYAAFITFGMGAHARAYLNGKPQDLKDLAILFKGATDGFLPASPFFFETMLKYQEVISKEIDKRIQNYFNSL